MRKILSVLLVAVVAIGVDASTPAHAGLKTFIAGGIAGIAARAAFRKALSSPEGEEIAGKVVSKVIEVAKRRFGGAVEHIEDAQKLGQPSRLTIDRGPQATLRRSEALRGQPRVKGMDRDEYPPAMFKEGGAGSSVRPVEPGANRGCGAYIGRQCAGLPNGSVVEIKPVE